MPFTMVTPTPPRRYLVSPALHPVHLTAGLRAVASNTKLCPLGALRQRRKERDGQIGFGQWPGPSGPRCLPANASEEPRAMAQPAAAGERVFAFTRCSVNHSVAAFAAS